MAIRVTIGTKDNAFFSPKEEKRESDNKIMILYYNIIYFCSLTYSSNLVRKNGCPIVPIVTPTPHKASDRPYVIKKNVWKAATFHTW